MLVLTRKSGQRIRIGDDIEIILLESRNGGCETRRDLRRFVEDVCRAADVPVAERGERILTIQELAERFNVSTKTISRWRRRGLVSRRFVVDGRERIGFLESSVDRFVAENSERVRRGTCFSQMTDQERTGIIERARRLARAGVWPAAVIRQLAEETGRSLETIRYTIKRFDRRHPHAAVFPDAHEPPSQTTKEKIYRRHLRGASLDALARHFCRSRASVRRILAEMRARRILRLPLEYVPNEQFDQIRSPRQEREILRPMPPADQPVRLPRVPAGLPPYLRSLYDLPLLTGPQEVHLFRKMNYLKYKAAKLLAKLRPERPNRAIMDRIERLYGQAVATKNQIIRANLRLVVSIAKRHVGPAGTLFELISDGNVSLIRAVERFDFARGNKFSTYASWAIMKNFARSIPDEHRRRTRFRTGLAEMFSEARDDRADHFDQEEIQRQRETQVEKILQRLDERERAIIVQRYGLQGGQDPLTLREVGANMGVTKERIRQLETRALRKLRQAAEEEKIEVPDLA